MDAQEFGVALATKMAYTYGPLNPGPRGNTSEYGRRFAAPPDAPPAAAPPTAAPEPAAWGREQYDKIVNSNTEFSQQRADEQARRHKFVPRRPPSSPSLTSGSSAYSPSEGSEQAVDAPSGPDSAAAAAPQPTAAGGITRALGWGSDAVAAVNPETATAPAGMNAPLQSAGMMPPPGMNAHQRAVWSQRSDDPAWQARAVAWMQSHPNGPDGQPIDVAGPAGPAGAPNPPTAGDPGLPGPQGPTGGEIPQQAAAPSPPQQQGMQWNRTQGPEPVASNPPLPAGMYQQPSPRPDQPQPPAPDTRASMGQAPQPPISTAPIQGPAMTPPGSPTLMSQPPAPAPRPAAMPAPPAAPTKLPAPIKMSAAQFGAAAATPAASPAAAAPTGQVTPPKPGRDKAEMHRQLARTPKPAPRRPKESPFAS